MKRTMLACATMLLVAVVTALFEAGAEVLMTEVMASNGVYQDGNAYDWVELHNTDHAKADLSGWHLSDTKKDPIKWTFPEGTTIDRDGYLLVYCTGEKDVAAQKGNACYANFKISSSGDTLYLSNADGQMVQKLKLPVQYGCVSYGMAAGSGAYGYFENATPGKTNEETVCGGRLDAPFILTPGGYADPPCTVQAEGPDGSVLRYTTDGSTPTESSPVFPQEGITFEKTGVLRVRAFAEGYVSSPTVSTTYLLNDEQLTPVVCLVTDNKYLFDDQTGALVRGTGSVANYSQELEYPVNIEYYNLNNACEINQMGTFTLQGYSSRRNLQKSIALYARKAYGDGYFRFNPFPVRDYTEYKSLLLRGANSDMSGTRMRDMVGTSLAENQGILYQDGRVIQVFINGKYWGHYNLREKINKYFIAQYEHVTDEQAIDAIDILKGSGEGGNIQNGDNNDWLELCDFCKTMDLNVPENLDYVEERLDIDTVFTHAAMQIILGNDDYTNFRVYRVPGGKWKYMLFDVEACWSSLDHRPADVFIKPKQSPASGFRHEPLNALLEVPEMRARFLRRTAQLLEECFQYPHLEAHINPVVNLLEQILPRHAERWGNITMNGWHSNVDNVKYHARVRPRKIPEILKKTMKLTDEEMDEYFAEVTALLEITNARPEN